MNLVWFRDDLRLSDNPAVSAALNPGARTCFFYILEEGEGVRPLGGASKWWLHRSLLALDSDLRRLGGKLILRRGDPRRIVPALAQEFGATHLFWNRRYAPSQVALDTEIKSHLKTTGVEVRSFKANLLFEPWEVSTNSGGAFKVFTPFWKACLKRKAPVSPLKPPDVVLTSHSLPQTDALDDWRLSPSAPDWAYEFENIWRPGEVGARQRLNAFLEGRLNGYAAHRDFPALDQTSGLSPHLRFGEISPRQIWNAVDMTTQGVFGSDASKFLTELGWREFSTNTLFHARDLANENWRSSFNEFAWRDDPTSLEAWKRGATGYPLVDAGMRQLWRTGTMHNRVRMVVASFLSKHLLIDWRVGEKWFWDTLVDADPANNPAGWQWVAGCGADAAPYFRIFNPITQSRKFDPDGAYIRHWAPELSGLSAKDIHAPWLLDNAALAKAGVELGRTYPLPIVEHSAARQRALDTYAALDQA